MPTTKDLPKYKRSSQQLPRKRSELIRLALKDLISCRRSPLFSVRMFDWLVPLVPEEPESERGAACAVCFAASVMAKSLEVPTNEYADPTLLRSVADQNKLYFLNDVRCYMLAPDVGEIFKDIMFIIQKSGMPEYEDDYRVYRVWKKNMLLIADAFEAHPKLDNAPWTGKTFRF